MTSFPHPLRRLRSSPNLTFCHNDTVTARRFFSGASVTTPAEEENGQNKVSSASPEHENSSQEKCGQTGSPVLRQGCACARGARMNLMGRADHESQLAKRKG